MKNYVTVNTLCPRDKGKVYPVYVYCADINGGRFPVQCNGCDNLCGMKVCENCRSAVTSYLLQHQKDQLPEILDPKAI